MPILTDKDIWKEIVARAELGADSIYLQPLRYEFKRDALFLRVPTDIELPSPVYESLKYAADKMGYTLRVTGQWATMADLQYAVGEISWFWENWIPNEMVTLLAGEPGTGKSHIALWLCKIAAEGLALPDGQVLPPRRTIFVDAEAGQVISKGRCEEMSIPLSNVYIPNLDNDTLAQPDLDNPSHKEQLWNMVEDVKPSLIVIDSMGGIKSGGENRKEEMQPTMLYLTQLVRNRGCGIIIIHHLNKTKREEGEEITMNHLRGSTAIAQFARSILFLSKRPQGVKLWVGKSNIAQVPDALKVVPRQEYVEGKSIIRGFDFEEWQDEIKTTKMDDCQRWILNNLAENAEGYVFNEIKEMAKDEPYTLHMLKDAGAALERKGLIRRTGGKFSIWSILQLPMSENGNGHQNESE